MADQKKICIVGSGNWGSVIAKIVGNNVQTDTRFNKEVQMYVYEELVEGQKLTEIINTKHENIKYLPGTKLPENVIANPDIVSSAKDADILIFVVPHQFIRTLCQKMKGNLKPGAFGISLIKGLDISDKGLDLISNVIREDTGLNMAVLMGANIAPEVAKEDFCEATIGCKDEAMGKILKDLFQTDYFRIVVVPEAESVELCGALKNVVAVGAGFVDGLNFGDNTKSAVIRLGLMEIIKFIEEFYKQSKLDTFLQSCGVADLVTTCYSGRNRRVAEAFVKSGKKIDDLEREMLNGQKLQGPQTAAEVNVMLKAKNLEDRFPLFTAVHRICIGELKPTEFMDCLRNHPEHMDDRPYGSSTNDRNSERPKSRL